MRDDPINTTQSVGDLIGRAIRVYRLNVLPWAQILIWPTVAMTLGRGMFSGGASAIGAQMDSQGLIMVALVVLGLGVLLLAKWWLIVRELALVRLSTGFASSLSESLAYTSRRKWSILGVLILSFSVVFAVMTLWLLEVVASLLLVKVVWIPAVIGVVAGVLGMILSANFVMIAMYIALCAVACEESSITNSISKAFAMSSKTFFRTMWAGLMIWFTIFIIAAPLWLPMFGLLGLDMVRLGPEAISKDSVPFHWNILFSAWESLIEMVSGPIMYLSYGFFYYDMRLRSEGVDLVQNLETLKLQQDALR